MEASGSVTLTSSAGSNNQTVCINSPINKITYTTTGGATGATFSGLPTGTTGSWANNTITISGTPSVSGTFNYTITLTSNCSTITDTGSIIVYPNATSTDLQTACDSFTWLNGITYTTSTNIPKDTLVAANGCDSVVTLNLTINNSATSTDLQTACDSFTWINGMTYTASTNTPKDTLITVNGCDSIVTLNLTINTFASSTDVITSCTPITWIDGNTYSATTNTPTFTITGGAANGCDSIVTLNFTIIPPTSTTQTFNECEGYSITVGANTYSTTGTFIDVLNGCDTVTTNLTINPAPQLTLIKTDDNCDEQTGSVTAIASSNSLPITYNWNTGSTDSIINNLPAGIYSIIVVDNNNCMNTDSVLVLNITTNCEPTIFIPNVFSPNGDNHNDLFMVQLVGLEFESLQIYNRWGILLFQTESRNEGWDGRTTAGEIAADGTYFYILNYKDKDEKQIKKGTLTLIR